MTTQLLAAVLEGVAMKWAFGFVIWLAIIILAISVLSGCDAAIDRALGCDREVSRPNYC